MEALGRHEHRTDSFIPVPALFFAGRLKNGNQEAEI
jgi:hypothetical protein